MKRRYWVVRLGEGGKFVQDGKKGNYIAIGWGDLGDLEWLAKEDIAPEKLERRLWKLCNEVYGGSSIQMGLYTGMLWSFTRDMNKNDVVLVPDPVRRKVLIGKITGPYQYKEDWGDGCYYPRRREVEWIEEFDRDDLPEKLKQSLNAWLTVFNVDRHRVELEKLIGAKIVPEEEVVSGDKLTKVIIDRLMDLNPREFEEFTSHLLGLAGFETATTEYVGDKGVDVIGSLSAEGLANLSLRVQVRRISGNIGITEVQRIRGTLGRDEHGAIVTTSRFTKRAQEEAQAENKKPIALIDGEMLVELVLTHYDKLDEKYKDLLAMTKKEPPLKERFFTIVKKERVAR